jgi:predicted dehydrogenase
MTPLRIGIIGCGNVLEAYLPQCARLHQRSLAEVIVGCGRAHQEGRSRRLGIPRFTTREEEIIDSAQVDLIVILASMPEHGRLANAALKAGKHVLMEKPLATNLEDAAELLDLARHSRRHLVCAPFTTLSPTFHAIASRIRNGHIGKPCSARGRYGWSGPWWNTWFYEHGGGCLFDLGVYSLTTLTGLLGPVRRVTAFAGVAIPQREIEGRRVMVQAEDNAQVLLDFGEACFGVVTTGFTLQQYRSPAIEVYGTTGVVQMLGDDWNPDGYELWKNEEGCWKVFRETHPDWPWTDGLRHLVECIHSGAKPRVCPEHALHVLEVMLKAQKSAREGRAETIESTFELPPAAEATPPEGAHLAHDRTREHA